MTLHEHLDQFYHTHNIPEEGGVNDKTFDVPLPGFTLTLPNTSWRKKMLYIHDLEHVLNEQDTSWKGEMYIASWEIATGYYRNFPIITFPLWTMGWGLWIHPKTVFTAFRKGNSDKGIARLNLEKKELLQLDLLQLRNLTLNHRQRTRFSFYIRFITWSLVAQLVFLFPVLFLTAIYIFFLR